MSASFSPEQIEAFDRQGKLAGEYMERGVPFVQAIVMAGDRISAEWVTAEVASGEPHLPVESMINLVGSYARFEVAMEWVEAGYLRRQWVLDNLPELWRGSDPDDTKPEYLRLWRQAWEANGPAYVRDGRPLPRTRRLKVYRGQQAVGDPVGIAWSLDPKVAAKFARGIRVGTMRGEVIHGEVQRALVLGYLTGRGEAEVVVDPAHVRVIAVHPVTAGT